MRYGPRSYIPQPQDEFANWAANFDAGGSTGAVGVTLGYAQYNLAYSQIYSVHSLTAAYAAALAAAPSDRRSTPALTDAKRAARIALELVIRPLAQQIANSPEATVSRARKLALGINPHFNVRSIAGSSLEPRTRIQVSDAAPEFDLLPSDNLTITIRYHYSGAGLRTARSLKRSNAKPVGAVGVAFYYKLTPPAAGRDPYEGMVPMDNFTRSPSTYTFPPNVGGRTAYIAARWYNARGELSKWSGIQSCTIPLQGVVFTPGA